VCELGTFILFYVGYFGIIVFHLLPHVSDFLRNLECVPEPRLGGVAERWRVGDGVRGRGGSTCVYVDILLKTRKTKILFTTSGIKKKKLPPLIFSLGLYGGKYPKKIFTPIK